jgi:cbb3-type cytochrome oxidase maturation protein
VDITFYLFFVSLLVAFAAWCVFLWAIRTGQFHEVEDIKFQVWPEHPLDPGASPPIAGKGSRGNVEAT